MTATTKSPRCTCGHPTAEHQTGSGAYTGWCSEPECDCEAPTLAFWHVCSGCGRTIDRYGRNGVLVDGLDYHWQHAPKQAPRPALEPEIPDDGRYYSNGDVF